MKSMRVGVAAALLASVAAAGADEALEARIAELEKQVSALSEETEKFNLRDVVVEPGESIYGLGPAASKVYNKQQGVSIGGYGEMLYENFSDSGITDEIDYLRWVLYAGYKYNEKFVFNSEIEVEHADEIYVEFAYLDYLHSDALNLRAGLVLIPMGMINKLHEPITYLSARRPDTETRIIPSTWRENGIGAFGDLGPFSYEAYVVNGLDGEDFTAAGVRGGRQKGSEAKADDFAYVGRLDYTAVPGLIVGGSAYYGDSGQDLDVDATTTIIEGHVDWKWKGFDIRGLVAAAQIDDVADLNAAIAEKKEIELADFDSVGEDLFGWYIQLGYDVMNILNPGETSLTPFVRYEQIDTQESVPSGFEASGKNDLDVVTVGLNFKPIEELALKVEYQFYDDEADSVSDQFNAGIGYVF